MIANMSNEYGASSNKNDTLVDDSECIDPDQRFHLIIRSAPAALEQNSGTGNVDNYANDSSDSEFSLLQKGISSSLLVLATASGGYGGTGNAFSDRSQRGLVDQSLDPGQFGRSNSTSFKPDTRTAEHRGR
jgi:hypothetical protein